MRLEIITFLTHMILLRGWEPPGYRRGYSRKGTSVCEGGRCPAPAGAEAALCMLLVYVCFGKYPVCFQFYRTKCQSKLRHVIFWNICIKKSNLRKFFFASPIL